LAAKDVSKAAMNVTLGGEMSSSMGKVVAGLVGLALVGGMVVAFRYSQKRGALSEVEREARLELVRFSGGIARHGIGNSLPETTKRVPARLADVSGKKYASTSEDWSDEGFAAAMFQAPSPQSVQYRWLKLSVQSGRVEARADVDGDGRPDTWFEIDVSCPKANECEAANFVHEVTADGVRQPPGLLAWLGRAPTFVGEPPSLEAEDEAAPKGSLSRYR
jgi:hypothetical protein